jgi:hypothetical protein
MPGGIMPGNIPGMKGANGGMPGAPACVHECILACFSDCVCLHLIVHALLNPDTSSPNQPAYPCLGWLVNTKHQIISQYVQIGRLPWYMRAP